MEENEWTFCSLWTRKMKIGCSTALVNPVLQGDYFFNRVTTESCKSISASRYKKIALLFKTRYDMDCPFYFFRSEPPHDLLRADILYSLRMSTKENKEDIGPVEPDVITKRVTCDKELALWIDIFCNSFSVPEWRTEIESRFSFSSSSSTRTRGLEFYLAFKAGSLAGCMACLTVENVTGLYCLGTLPALRKKGVGRAMLSNAETLAKQKRSDFLFLQTLDTENLLGFYNAAGFKVAYTKTIYKISE